MRKRRILSTEEKENHFANIVVGNESLNTEKVLTRIENNTGCTSVGVEMENGDKFTISLNQTGFLSINYHAKEARELYVIPVSRNVIELATMYMDIDSKLCHVCKQSVE